MTSIFKDVILLGHQVVVAKIYKDTWMLSSVGRASPLQGEGRGFESPSIHHFFEKNSWKSSEVAKRG